MPPRLMENARADWGGDVDAERRLFCIDWREKLPTAAPNQHQPNQTKPRQTNQPPTQPAQPPAAANASPARKTETRLLRPCRSCSSPLWPCPGVSSAGLSGAGFWAVRWLSVKCMRSAIAMSRGVRACDRINVWKAQRRVWFQWVTKRFAEVRS